MSTTARPDQVSLGHIAAVNDGDLARLDDLLATGRPFEAEYRSVERVAGGRIVERWELADSAAITTQLTGESAA